MSLTLDELICRFECAILSRPNAPDNPNVIHTIAYTQALKHLQERTDRELREIKEREAA